MKKLLAENLTVKSYLISSTSDENLGILRDEINTILQDTGYELNDTLDKLNSSQYHVRRKKDEDLEYVYTIEIFEANNDFPSAYIQFKCEGYGFTDTLLH